ncbi:DUF6973 domain-containing protein [Planobacterium oryzisoli]|uniref:DUF6973 domain-containing protein n=1 Tax=Planobacterium oryzisoli TaxID=2771435 RepID=A0A931E9P9_9FLAO|nr:hypothetical protein [Planobacterium oryzisoli]MBF5027532.1 hypothetical protein [Planobacterium oryzisoli]
MRSALSVVVSSLRSLSLKKILKLLSLALSHPLFTLLSLYATLRTFSIAKRYFPYTNSTSGVGNAFRHALWCCLILMYCSKISSPEKARRYCKKFTDLHEELFPNEPLEKKMDLHNNSVGIHLYFELLEGVHRQFFETGFFIEHLLIKCRSAQILDSDHTPEASQLVYLRNEND